MQSDSQIAKVHHLKGLHLIFKSLTLTKLKFFIKTRQCPNIITRQYRPRPPFPRFSFLIILDLLIMLDQA